MALQEVGVKLVLEGAGGFLGELNNVNGAVEKFARTTKDAFSGLQDAGKPFDAISARTDAAGLRLDDFGRRAHGLASAAGGGFTALEQIAIGSLRRIGEAAIEAGAQVVQAVAGFAKDSVGAAGEFEDGMNQFAAAAGGSLEAAGLEVEDFKELFLSLGAELPVSTKEVQDAAIALVKGGIDPAIVAAGGLESSLQFAAAAGMGLEEAAELGVKMLGTFTDISDDAATKTAFLAESQDLLVRAAGASTLNVDMLGDAMLAAGGQARAVGLDYAEFVTTMGLISPAFGSAAEAGTSFKNFLVRLQPSTQPAKDAMTELGLMMTSTTKITDFLREQGIKPLGTDLDTLGNQFTEWAYAQGWTAKEIEKVWDSFAQSKFFDDATGKFVGMEEASRLLEGALGDLTDAQRIQVMQAIFGNDAMGAAGAIARAGAEGYAAFAAQMAQTNGVMAQAEAVQQGYDFAITNFQGSVESLQITIGLLLLPVLTTLLEGVLTPGINIVTNFVNTLTGSRQAFDNLPAPIQAVIAPFLGLSSALASTSEAVRDAATPLFTFQNVLAGLPVPVAEFITALVNGFGVLTSLIQTLPLPSLAGMFASVGGALSVILPPITEFINGLALVGEYSMTANLSFGLLFSVIMGGNPIIALALGLFGGLGGVLEIVQGALAPMAPAFAAVAAALQDAGPFSAEFAEALSLIHPALQPVMNGISQVVGWLQNNWQPAVAAAGAIVAAMLVPGLLAGAAAFGAAVAAAAPVVAIFAGVGVAAAALYSTWENNVGGIRQSTETAMAAVQSIVTSVMGIVASFWEKNGASILAFTERAWQQVQEIIAGVVGIIAELLAKLAKHIEEHGADIEQILTGAWQVIEGTIGGILTLLQGTINTTLALIRGDWEGAWQAVQDMTAELLVRLGDIILGLWNMFEPGLKHAWEQFVKWAESLGSDVVSGIVKGVEGAASSLFDALKGLAGNALSEAKKALGIGSPSRVFAEDVGLPISQGIAQGILDGLADVGDALDTIGEEALKQVEGIAAEMGKIIDDALSGQIGMIRTRQGGLGHLKKLYEDYYKLEAESAGLEGPAFEENQKQRQRALDQIGKIQQGLKEAQAEADRIGAIDPTAGAEFLALRQRQIQRLVELETEHMNAGRSIERDLIAQQIELERRAQQIEIEQLQNSLAERAQGLAELGAGFAETGNAVIDGMIKGMQDRASEMANALKEILMFALRGAQQQLGISSPSMVFAQQVGMPIAEGVAAGVNAAMPVALGAVNDLAAGLVRPAAPAMPRAGAGGSTVNHYWNYSPSYNGAPRQPSQDFAAMRVLATAR